MLTLGSHHGADFLKSSYSNPENCVFVARPAAGSVGVRDGKEGPTGPILEFERSEWSAFLEFAKELQV
ncbi:MAG: DUF397 domain-containing protein [Humibacter sp.]